MTLPRLEILYEDNHVLAVNKPPRLATMGVRSGQPSVVHLARQYIKRRYRKPGNVYLGIVSRLDAGTSGVVLLARTSKAAARLTRQFRNREVCKIYWAILTGDVDPPAAELVDWVAKDEARMRMAIVNPRTRGAKEARLRYRRLKTVPGGTLVEIELSSGRKHQIRLQMASRGFPVWGETKYATGKPFGQGLALHARSLTLEHPVRKTPLQLIAPLPPAWRALGLD
jgi:23S rRNA pseudouridine1911/1915/1917 synthase